MIISLFSGATLKVSDDIAVKIDHALASEAAPKSIKIPLLNGDTATVVTSTINGLWSEDQWGIMEHEKVGDWRCSSEHWHRKHETFCNAHVKKDKVEAAPWIRAKSKPASEDKTRNDKWVRMIQINMEHANITGKHGTLRSLEDLEAYDATGEMPAVAKPLEPVEKSGQTPVFPVAE
jgi:hypothetical protein